MTKQNTSENSEEPQTPEQINPKDSRLSAVRDLLFGENIEEYKAEFDTLREEIAVLKSESNDQLSAAVKDLSQRLNEIEKNAADRHSKLEAEMSKQFDKINQVKADRFKLGKALEKIAQNLQQ